MPEPVPTPGARPWRGGVGEGCWSRRPPLRERRRTWLGMGARAKALLWHTHDTQRGGAVTGRQVGLVVVKLPGLPPTPAVATLSLDARYLSCDFCHRPSALAAVTPASCCDCIRVTNLLNRSGVPRGHIYMCRTGPCRFGDALRALFPRGGAAVDLPCGRLRRRGARGCASGRRGSGAWRHRGPGPPDSRPH